jgi:DNA-binding Xre family transcriptional regulator
MEIHPYSKTYLSDVSENLGAMLEYANQCGYEIETFWQCFINSTVALQIEKGNPKFLVGYSGIDLVNLIIDSIPKQDDKITSEILNKKQILSFNKYYWAGWSIAQLQYETDYSFLYIEKYFSISKILELYPTLHEADITKFINVAKTYLKDEKKLTNLKQIRLASGLSQKELAEQSGVELRSIQMYEQKRNDINKAQAETLQKLAKILGCNIEDLLEID